MYIVTNYTKTNSSTGLRPVPSRLCLPAQCRVYDMRTSQLRVVEDRVVPPNVNARSDQPKFEHVRIAKSLPDSFGFITPPRFNAALGKTYAVRVRG